MSKKLIQRLLREAFVDESNIVDIERLLPDVDRITNTKLIPIIKTLYNGIRKIKTNKFDTLTSEELENVKLIFKGIFNTRTKKFNDGYKLELTDTVGFGNLTNLYKLKTLKGDDTEVSVGFYYDEDSSATANFVPDWNWIVVNIAAMNPLAMNELKSTIRHELVHAVDPKIINSDLYWKLNPEDGDKGGDDLQRYHKKLHEFDAFTQEIINNIIKNLNKLDKYDTEGIHRNAVISDIWNIVDSIPHNDVMDLYHNYGSRLVSRFFTENGLLLKSNKTLTTNFHNALKILKDWSTKPTMYKRFRQRLVRYVPYKKD